MTRRLGPLVPDLARGLRAAIATLLPFYLARRYGVHELAWTAIGGWLGTLVDPGGWRGTRARLLVAFAAAGVIIVAVAEAASSSTPLGMLVLAAVAFLGSIARASGNAASSAGLMLVVTAAIALGGLAGDPLRDAGAFFAGAMWAVVLSSIVWPIWTHLPVRALLAKCFEELEAYRAALDRAVEEEWPRGDARWTALAATHQRATRAAIEAARDVALASRARRSGESAVGSNLRTMLAVAERLLPLLAAATVELESDADARAHWTPSSHVLRDAANEVASLLQTPMLRVERAPLAPAPSLPPAAHPLFGRIANAARLSVQIARNVGAPPNADLPPLAGSPARAQLRTLRDALSPRSTHFHHATRVVLAVMAAQLAGRMLSPEHVSWITVTTIGVLQPYPGATMKRAAERVLGTVLGSVVAVAVMFAVTSPGLLALVMVPLSVAAVATKPRSYRLFTLFLTPVFVLLAERWSGDWWVAAARAGDAAIGGAIALAAAMIFPSREERRLDAALARLRLTLRRYTRAAFDAHVAGTSSSPAVVEVRREVGVALGEAEASLERMLAEPLRSKTDAEDAMLYVTQARRFAGAITALDQEHVRAPDPEGTKAIADLVDAALGPDGDAEPLAHVAPSRPDLERIVRQAALLTHAAR